MSQNPAHTTTPQKYLDTIQDHITGINAFLNNHNDLENPKIQSAHRLLLSYFKEFRQMAKYVDSLTEPETPPEPEPDIPPNWNSGIETFAREALGITLYPHQIQIGDSTQRINILIAGRGAGKSLAAQVKAIHKAVTSPAHTVLVVSSGQRMSSDFGQKLLDLIRATEISRRVESISNEKVIFSNGSTIHLLPANPDTIRGYHPKHHAEQRGMTVILDEACFMEQGAEIQKAVEYTLITTPGDAGQLYIVSSPTSTGSWVYPYIRQADTDPKNIAVFQCPSTANPNISQDEIERLRACKNELEFRAEVLGEWVDGAMGLFAEWIEPNIIHAADPPETADFALGADLALSFNSTHDRSALAVAAAWFPDDSTDLEARYRIIEIISLNHVSDKELRSTVSRLTEKYPIQTAAIEQFQGKALAEHCGDLGIETQLTAASLNQQRLIFHEFHRLLRQGLLELPDSLPELFFEELHAFEYRREKNGNISFGHPHAPNAHDDTVYAAAWAIHALSIPLPRTKPTNPFFFLETVPKTPP